MRPRPKPDPSYASNRLTRTNKPTRHLLSNFNKPNDDFALSDDDLPGKDSKEPATDDEPLSSSDEASDADVAPSKPKTLEEKLADGDKDAQSLPPPSSGLSSRKSALTRTSSMMDDDAEPIFFSSQPKRSRTTYDRSNSNSYSRTPTSSALSAPTPGKKSQSQNDAKKSKGKGKGKSKSKSKEDDSRSGESGSDSDSDSGSNTPIDITSPEKPRAANSGFKMPSTFTMESTSNSSLGTHSSKPPQFEVLDDDDSISPLSTPPSSPSSPSEYEPRDPKSEAGSRPASPPRRALCPMCKAEVDLSLLIQFEAQPKQRIREQQQFCASHQQHTAEKEWSAQGYPDINWELFDERAQKYFPDIEKLLVPDCTSYYRNILVTSYQSGQSKNFRLTLAGDAIETISCGYYGTRGSQKM